MSPKRVDANQAQIVRILRDMGCSVAHMHELGKGAPDILVGFRGENFIFEIKDPDKPPSQRRLTEDEEKWHTRWKGQVNTVLYAYDIVEIIKGKCPEK